MKIRSVGAELFHAETGRQTDRQADMIKLIVVFRYFADAPKNLFLVSRIEIRFLACPSRSLVTILTELFGPRRRLSGRFVPCRLYRIVCAERTCYLRWVRK